MELTTADRALLSGEGGEAAALAMRILVHMAPIVGAERLVDITGAHIDGCLYHGRASLDFAERLVAADAHVTVPTTLNVGSLDLLHPDRYRGDPATADRARRLMDCYVAMGCEPTWTCAPYQLPRRPGLGEHIAWAESNAIVFANSVLGARTNREGDFVDICAALTGRAPEGPLHRDDGRRAEVVFDLSAVPPGLLAEDVCYPVLGHLLGRDAGGLGPVITGLPPAEITEDRLKALGAAAASSGSVALFHAVGGTPEAPTLEAALGGRAPRREVTLTAGDLARARDELSTTPGADLAAVSVGTPHFSLAEFAGLLPLLDGVRVHPDVEFYVSTGRDVLDEVRARGWLDPIEAAGLRVLTDTCTYVTPILGAGGGTVMTNSAKWAWYAPANLGVDVVFASLRECVRSAAAGRVERDGALWADG